MILIVACALITVFTVTMMVFGFLAGMSNGSPLMGLPYTIALVLVIVAVISMSVSFRRSRVTRYRLSRFAAANGMTYEDEVDDPPLPGMIFNLGRSRQAKQLVRGHSPRFVEFGNYRYTTGSGKNSTTHTWGYVAVKLDVPLPNIVLDALGNNGFGTNLPTSFHKAQQLSLEGDFNKFFTLYCPEGYEADALYLFTPDIMARFIDNAAQLDVEIADDWLFLYTKRDASTLDAATWAWLFGAVGALITKFDQWARWRDGRLNHLAAAASIPAGMGTHALPFAPPTAMLTPPPGVAQPGQRLKRRVRWVPIVIALVIGIGWTVMSVVLR